VEVVVEERMGRLEIAVVKECIRKYFKVSKDAMLWNSVHLRLYTPDCKMIVHYAIPGKKTDPNQIAYRVRSSHHR